MFNMIEKGCQQGLLKVSNEESGGGRKRRIHVGGCWEGGANVDNCVTGTRVNEDPFPGHRVNPYYRLRLMKSREGILY
jgi:hypothetical protein